MAKIWEPQDIEIYKSWVSAILDEASDNLNDWESNFVTNIQYQLIRGKILTQPQADKLESIYTDKTK